MTVCCTVRAVQLCMLKHALLLLMLLLMLLLLLLLLGTRSSVAGGNINPQLSHAAQDLDRSCNNGNQP